MKGDFIIVVIGRAVAALAAIAAIRLSTSLLNPEQYGMLAVLMIFQMFCGLFLINPVGQYINRNTHSWHDDQTLLERLLSYRLWVFLVGLIGAISFNIWSLYQPLSFNEKITSMLSVSFMVVGATWNATLVGILNMLGKRVSSVGWSALTSCTGLLLSSLLATKYHTGVAWFLGQAIGMTLGAIGANLTLLRIECVTSYSRKPLLNDGALRSYIMPLALATGCMWWLLSGYRIIFEHYWGLASLGMITVGLGLAAQLWGLFETFIIQFLFPFFYRRISRTLPEQGSEAFSDLINTICPIYLIFTAAAIFVTQSIITIMVSTSYRDIYIYVILGMLLEFTRAFGNVFATAAQVEGRMRLLIPPYAIGALILTGGIYYIGSQKGSVVEAIAVIPLASAIMLLVMGYQIRRIIIFKIDWIRIGWASLIILIGGFLSFKYPWHIITLQNAINQVLCIGILTSCIWFALLWKNKALERLIKTHLS